MISVLISYSFFIFGYILDLAELETFVLVAKPRFYRQFWFQILEFNIFGYDICGHPFAFQIAFAFCKKFVLIIKTFHSSCSILDFWIAFGNHHDDTSTMASLHIASTIATKAFICPILFQLLAFVWARFYYEVNLGFMFIFPIAMCAVLCLAFSTHHKRSPFEVAVSVDGGQRLPRFKSVFGPKVLGQTLSCLLGILDSRILNICFKKSPSNSLLFTF